MTKHRKSIGAVNAERRDLERQVDLVLDSIKLNVSDHCEGLINRHELNRKLDKDKETVIELRKQVVELKEYVKQRLRELDIPNE